MMVSIWPDGSGQWAVTAAYAQQVDKPILAKSEKQGAEQEANARTQDSTQPGLTDNKDYRHSWIDVDGVKTHYIEAGEGDPFVLVHGALAWSSGEANYGDVIGPLGKQFHAIALDIIGWGYTTPRGPQDYPGQAQGAFLIRFIEALDVGPVFLAGNSHGGFLTQYVAHKRPDLVRKLIITNSLSGTAPIPPQPEGGRYVYAPGGHQYPSQTVEQIRRVLERYYQHKDLVTEERVKLVYDNYLRNYEFADKRGKAVLYSVEAYNETLSYKGKHISEWAGELKLAVLLMWSEPGSRIEWGLSHFFKVPGAEMHLLPWSGHHLFTDQSDRWVQVVTNWLKNEPVRPRNVARKPMQRKWRESWIDVDEVKAHYIEAGKAGEADTLVLVHGGGPTGGINWVDTVNHLSDDFHVVAPDIVGSGFTAPIDPQHLSSEAQGEFLIGFIEALDVGPVFLAGHSHGGFTTQYVAHERPDLVKRLIITNSLSGTVPIPPSPGGDRFTYGPGGQQFEIPTVEQTRQYLRRHYSHKEMTENLVQSTHETLAKTYAFFATRGKTLYYSVEAYNEYLSYKGKHVGTWAGELKMPVLLLWSEPGSKIEWGLHHFKKVPGSEMHLFPYSSHPLYRDQAERWAQVATDWLKNETARPPN